MIYEFKTHSINIENRCKKPTFSLTIRTLEIVADYDTKKVLYVQGFIPLITAEQSIIDLPKSYQGSFFLKNIDYKDVDKYDVFSLLDKMPKSKKYFEKNTEVFDKENGIIQLGSNDKKNTKFIKISNNIIVGHDCEGVIKMIYILPDKFI